MKRLLATFLILLPLIGQCEEFLGFNLAEQLRQLDRAVYESTLPLKVDCNSSEAIAQVDRTVSNAFVKDILGRDVEISAVSKEYLDYLFTVIAKAPHIPFDYPQDGCFGRAHEMVKILDKFNVNSGKVFLEGNLQVETDKSPNGKVFWWYHVAPVVAVKTGRKKKVKYSTPGSRIVRTRMEDEYIPHVLDPSIFDKPVPLSEWIAIQTKHEGARVDRSYYTRKYNAFPDERKKRPTDYIKANEEYIKNKLEEFSNQVDDGKDNSHEANYNDWNFDF
ncbi:MAG: hypothetical protein CME64_08155 [Halobacteriovoraceae bacterium]|nr:hypothetical protein [Halobacteriovoraceae bacterium]|tara:strand:- start:178357 stop:179184 length:828 start_codon:yes stop_codon:yes gene_type:complete